MRRPAHANGRLRMTHDTNLDDKVRTLLKESVDVARPLDAVSVYFLGDGSWFASLAMAALRKRRNPLLIYLR